MDEILVDLPAAPVVHSGGAVAVVRGAVSSKNQNTTWSVEYRPTEEYGAVTSAQSLPADSDLHQVSAALPGSQAGGSIATGWWRTTLRERIRRGPRVRGGSSPGSDAYRERC